MYSSSDSDISDWEQLEVQGYFFFTLSLVCYEEAWKSYQIERKEQ